MFGLSKKTTRGRKTIGATIRCEALETRNLATAGLVGSLGLAAPAPEPVGLLLPAVQGAREAAARMRC